jgi:hypothetical protein
MLSPKPKSQEESFVVDHQKEAEIGVLVISQAAPRNPNQDIGNDNTAGTGRHCPQFSRKRIEIFYYSKNSSRLFLG